MKIINTFISDNEKIPEYALLSLAQLRKLNPDIEIEFICSNVSPYESFFNRHKITVVPQDCVTSPLLEKFNELSWLKKWGKPDTVHNSPNYFFHRAMERIYYLEARMRVCDIFNDDEVFHCENDIVCYYPLEVAKKDFLECGKNNKNIFAITPASKTTATMAIAYINSYKAIEDVCINLNYLLSEGEDLLLTKTRVDMINEMVLLKICMNSNIIQGLPIIPNVKYRYVYDPSSYGQFLGGTNNHGNGIGFTSSEHYLGLGLRNEDIKIEWKKDKPFVLFNNIKKPLFNLHVHSKNLSEFIDV